MMNEKWVCGPRKEPYSDVGHLFHSTPEDARSQCTYPIKVAMMPDKVSEEVVKKELW